MSSETERRMRAAIVALEQLFPNCGIVLLVTPLDAAEGKCVNYIGNGDRSDVVAMFRELAARWEGRRHDAPAKVQ